MFNLTAALTTAVATKRAKGTQTTAAGTRALKERARSEFAAERQRDLRTAHAASLPSGATDDERAAYWDTLVWSSDLGASGRFMRAIHWRELDLDLIGYKREDVLADAIEVAYANMLRAEDHTANRISRTVRVNRENKRLASARMVERALPITRGEVYRAIRYVYKRGLNAFGYTRRGDVPVFTSTGLEARTSMTVSMERFDATAGKIARTAAVKKETARIAALRSAGWIVENTEHPLTAHYADRMHAIVDAYPAEGGQLPLLLAQALTNGYTVPQFLAEVKAATGKEYAESTLLRWAKQVAQVNPGAAKSITSPTPGNPVRYARAGF